MASITEEERKDAVIKSKKNLSGVRLWTKLAFTETEYQDFLLRKLRGKRFLKYKTEAASLTVSEFEIKDYFEKNRYKFGNLPLDSFFVLLRMISRKKEISEKS